MNIGARTHLLHDKAHPAFFEVSFIAAKNLVALQKLRRKTMKNQPFAC